VAIRSATDDVLVVGVTVVDALLLLETDPDAAVLSPTTVLAIADD